MKKKSSKTQQLRKLRAEYRELKAEAKQDHKRANKYEDILEEIAYTRRCPTYQGCALALGPPVSDWCIFCRARLAVGLPVKADFKDFTGDEELQKTQAENLAAVKKKRIKLYYEPLREPPNEW